MVPNCILGYVTLGYVTLGYVIGAFPPENIQHFLDIFINHGHQLHQTMPATPDHWGWEPTCSVDWSTPIWHIPSPYDQGIYTYCRYPNRACCHPIRAGDVGHHGDTSFSCRQYG